MVITRSLSALAARKRQLNQLCTSAVEQQISQHKAENTHLRKRRRYLARQILKRVPLQQHTSNQRWLHAVTLVLAMWGFSGVVMPNQALAAGTGFVAEAAANPLAGFDVGSNAAPTFADIDGDGDLDAFIGEVAGGTIKYYRNTGTGFVADPGGNPLAGIDVGLVATPTFADIDGDGDLDAFIGEFYGTVTYYRNTGTGFVADPGGNPLAGFDVGSIAVPTFADIDGDGDLDAFVGESSGTVKYYRNTGTGFVADAGANPLAGINVGSNAAPTFADIDSDGDLDAFVGESSGTVKYYRNTGAGFVADAGANPLAGINVGSNAAPTFADIDSDGDLDAFIGEDSGTVKYYRNTGFVADPGGNPLAGAFVLYSPAPTFADIDGDGDLDAFIGEVLGVVRYHRNTQIDAMAQGTGFVADGAGNPLAGVNVGYASTPTFADIDGDGDLDAFVGEFPGTVKYYRNTEIDAMAPGTGFVADPGGNPLAGIDVGSYATPAFADIDGDGDLDAFVGEYDGSVKYYLNIGADTDGDGIPDYVEDSNGNGVVDAGETDPLNPDSDNDGLLDGVEDSNGNGIVDAGESDPLDKDSDGDGLTDGYEINVSGTDPSSPTVLNTNQCDINEDGNVNLGDLLLLQRQLMGLQ